MEHPSVQQSAVLNALAGADERYTGILAAQFAGCLTWSDDTCGECFHLRPTKDAPGLPFGTEQPLGFSARSASDGSDVQIYLWHTNGKVDWVEVSWTGDEHPSLAELQICTD